MEVQLFRLQFEVSTTDDYVTASFTLLACAFVSSFKEVDAVIIEFCR